MISAEVRLTRATKHHGDMQTSTLQNNVSRLRKQLEELHQAIANAAREGNIRRDVQLTLRACGLRRQLLQAQARMFR